MTIVYPRTQVLGGGEGKNLGRRVTLVTCVSVFSLAMSARSLPRSSLRKMPSSLRSESERVMNSW